MTSHQRTGCALYCLAAVTCSACGFARAERPQIAIEHCVARISPDGDGAVYADIVNRGAGADRLEYAEATGVEGVGIQEVLHDGGASRTLEVTDLALAAHAALHFQPGKLHLMLADVLLASNAETMRVLFHFAKSGVITSLAAIERTP